MSVLTQSASAVASPPLLTAEEYAELPEDGRFTELVRGRIVEMSRPKPKHGYYCLNIGSILRDFVRAHDLGRVVGNDSGVVTERGPDTVRGPDVAYYSYSVVPKGELPDSYWPTPELVFEVNSPNDRWVEVIAKVGEYLESGVRVVCVLDPESRTMHIYRPDAKPETLSHDEIFQVADLLPGFQMPIRSVLE